MEDAPSGTTNGRLENWFQDLGTRPGTETLSPCPPPQYLSDIQEHLGVTIPEVDNSFDVPVNEFDGKIAYGEKRAESGRAGFQYHTAQLAPSREQLMKLEVQAQSNFLKATATGSWFS